ncbi:TOTE conflict system archaeo-eukaryotic primase domain-containing protein [Arthrobacter sp. AZCC_0090]|uniref:TOTE conflict system archaeo-eukaryotic primase domain-containing protein n=1 Tax=Arthrobacter sp. AZCC_0090 TaxID=2735881 RepID=UPI0017954F6D|nr:DEAD/DEAH box helicase family protein [Arthrobacter sp. AZCC_0090]MBB6402717.1 superfamily II DNA or RNA helicase [Arthrobacter sp. AZCC_0090]
MSEDTFAGTEQTALPGLSGGVNHALTRELEELRFENARLRKLVDLTESESKAARPDQPVISAATPVGPVTMDSPPEAKVRLFQELFRARSDVYARRWENSRDGRSGWVPAVAGGWRKTTNLAGTNFLPLTPMVVADHLRGLQHIGLYPLTRSDTCWWVAADFDGSAAMLDALAYVKAARFRGIPAALEVSQSGRGAHVWIFFRTAVSARIARQLGTGLIQEAMGLRGSMSLSSYDRLFPSQDAHSGKGLGNLIAAPLNGKRRQDGTTLFLDTTTLEPFEDQWAYLSSLDRLSERETADLVRKLPPLRLGQDVRRLELPASSKIVPRPALVVGATFASRMTIKSADLGPAMISAVKHAASMQNPDFYERQRQRRSTWNIPRFLRSYDETLEGDLILRRGLFPLLQQLVQSAGSVLRVEDERVAGTKHDFRFTAGLRPEQQAAVDVVASLEQGILVAPPGTGKTVIACAAIARRGVSTLILVDRKALADQWRARVREFLDEKCGQIGGGRARTTGRIDVVLLPTLARRDNVAELTAGYGLVIADECHHVAAAAFGHVMNQIPAKHWLGLTATPYRRDNLHALMYHQLGQVVHTVSPPVPQQLPRHAREIPAPQLALELHRTKYIYDGDADPREPGGISAIYKNLVANEHRLVQICDDVIAAYERNSRILLLTTWKAHLEAFKSRFESAGLEPVVFSGAMKGKERQAAVERLAAIDDKEPLLVLGTGSYIGEGFDCPKLDTLFLAAPISFKGRLVQYAGRITRPYPDKALATVHDYHDELTPVLAASLHKRATGYVSLGFPDPRKMSSR